MTDDFKEAKTDSCPEMDKEHKRIWSLGADWAYNWCKFYVTGLLFRIAALEQRIRELENE